MLLPLRPLPFLGCAALLAGLALPWVTGAGAAPSPPAVDPVSAFLPAQAPVPAEPPDAPLTSADFASPAPLPDLLGPSQAISTAWRQALAGLTAGQAPVYEAVLDTGYRQTAAQGGEIGAAETGRRLDALLEKYQVADARFGVTTCRLTAPDAATVTVRERLELFTRNTPPTRLLMPNGKVALINNTTRLETLLVLRQDWVRRGAAWTLKRSRMSQRMSVAVL